MHNFLTACGVILAATTPALADVACTTVGSASVCQPVITSIVGHPNSIDVHWIPGGGTPPQQVRLVADGNAGLNFTDGKTLATASQASVLGMYTSYVLSAGGLAQGTRLQLLHVVGIWGDQALASAGFAGVTEVATTNPVPAVGAVQERHFSWGHMRSGDCEMDGASVIFRSNGTGAFSSKVKTNHTHNRDIWHETIVGQTAAGATLFQTENFNSMGMHDEHGYYDWSLAFTYNAAYFVQLGKADMHHSC